MQCAGCLVQVINTKSMLVRRNKKFTLYGENAFKITTVIGYTSRFCPVLKLEKKHTVQKSSSVDRFM